MRAVGRRPGSRTSAESSSPRWGRAEAHAGPGRIEPVRIVGGGVSGATMTRAAITVRWPQVIELAIELDAAGAERWVRELLKLCLR